MQVRLAAAIVAWSALAGCVAGPGPTGPCADAPILALPGHDAQVLVTDPRQAWDGVALFPGPQPVAIRSLDAGEGWVASWTAYGSQNATFGSFRVEPRADPPPRPSLVVAWDAHASAIRGCDATPAATHEYRLLPPEAGDVARPGQGVHVYTVGMWENGTVFYTNFEPMHGFDAWPKAGWYEWSGGDPLPVYVYDREPQERPVHWDPTAPLAGTPVRDGAPYAYAVTIPGFNEALKGLSTTTARVTWIAPEDAYTRPGLEGHALYGDPLVFWIRAQRVVDTPCPFGAPTALCTLPR